MEKTLRDGGFEIALTRSYTDVLEEASAEERLDWMIQTVEKAISLLTNDGPKQ